MGLIRLISVFAVVAVICPLVRFDLTHVVLVPLTLGAGLVAAGSLAVNAKSVAGPAFAWTCGLIGATVAADVIKVQVERAFGGTSGWLLAGIIAAGALALVAQIRGVRGGAAKVQRTSARVRAVVVEPQGNEDEAQAERAAFAVVEDEPDNDETEEDELHLFPRRARRGR